MGKGSYMEKTEKISDHKGLKNPKHYGRNYKVSGLI